MIREQAGRAEVGNLPRSPPAPNPSSRVPPPSFPASERRRGCQPCKCTVRVIREQRGPRRSAANLQTSPPETKCHNKPQPRVKPPLSAPLPPPRSPIHPPAACQTGPSGAERRSHLVAVRSKVDDRWQVLSASPR